MNYKDTITWMFSQLPMYQNKGKIAYKKDLTNSLNFSKHLNNPQKTFKSIHVAGTNGKGSTSHMIASVLQEAGYKVGLYTSPHLKDFRERIKVNGKPVSKQFVIHFIRKNKTFLDSNSLSFFEMTVGMAFDYFAKQNVDIAVIEVGLGGRLDSTNIITPEISVITNIGFDHMQFLGETLEKIAYEKAGIIKKNVPVVISETQDETKSVFTEIAKQNNAKIIFADTSQKRDFETDLKGIYQQHNIKAVIQTIEELKLLGYQISTKQITKGLLNVVKNTGLFGRWQKLQTHPTVICDTAHNKEGLGYVLKQIKAQKYKQLHMILGFVKEKNMDDLVALFPKDANYYFTQPDIPRALDKNILQQIFLNHSITGEIFSSVIEAYKHVLKIAQQDDLIFIGGSTFVVAEIL